MKILKYTLLTILCGIILICLSCYIYYKIEISPKGFANFLSENKNRVSIFYKVNDTVKMNINSDRMMPLASTLKWMVLIQYCKSVENNSLSPDTSFSIDEVSKYYLPNSDGDAHPNWIKELKKKNKIVKNKIVLRDIVQGMIAYSSNANTEFLMDLLTLDFIHKNMINIGVKNHENLVYLVSYAYYIVNTDTSYLNRMSKLEFNKKIDSIHYEIKSGKIVLNDNYDLSEEESHLFSLKMPKSTTEEYAQLMYKLNNRLIGGSSFHRELDSVFSFYWENEKNKSWIKRIGMKGGSTLEILTMSTYVQNIQGDKIELVYFINNLEILEYLIYQNAMNTFNIQLLTNKSKAKKIIKIINDED